MTCIFSNKTLLDQEYKQLFLKRISDCSQLADCIAGRYNRQAVSEEELNILFLNNHKKIYNFLGRSNENRIRYFFGTSLNTDIRDDQTRLIDRLILDSVHFDVINTLMMRFIEEYHDNQMNIDKEWETEIKQHEGLGIIPTDCIIQNAIKNNKNRIFNSLIFPSIKHVVLFKLSEKKVIPNEQVFKKWLPESGSTLSDYTSYVLVAGIITALILFTPLIYLGVAGSSAGFSTATITTSFTMPGLLVGIFSSLIMGSLLINPVTKYLNPINNKPNPPEAVNNHLHTSTTSTEMLLAKLPRNANNQSPNLNVSPNIKNEPVLLSTKNKAKNKDIKEDEQELENKKLYPILSKLHNMM